MIKIKNHNQLQIFDLWSHLGPKRRKLLNESWAGLFQKELLPVLPVEKLIPFFKEDVGRLTKELNTSIGIILFQQIFDLTDDETIEQLAFNIQWHYALNIPEESDDIKYLSPKTLWNLRDLFVKNSLEEDIFDSIRDKLAKIFDVDTRKQRIDSVHIKSNMRKLGRIRLIANTIKKFLSNLNRHHKELFESLEDNIIERYILKKSGQPFSMVKPSESNKTLKIICKDLLFLIEQFKDLSEISRMNSYQLMERVLEEQCIVTISGKDKDVEIKKPKDIPSNSLQNPSDEDASYSGHKGQGYQVQVMETYNTEEESPEKKSQILNLINHVEVEPAHESDANAIIPAIESTEMKGTKPEEVLADSLYGSEKNIQEAQNNDVDIISPLMGASVKSDRIELSDFQFGENGKIVKCPKNQTPIKHKIKKSGRHTVTFKKSTCENCSLKDKCPVVKGKKYYYLRFSNSDLEISNRRVFESSDEFKEKYRWRSGVEATMSEFDRKTGVKHLRVRGLAKVRFAAVLKSIGINIFRATRVRKARNEEILAFIVINYIFSIVKKQLDESFIAIESFFLFFKKFSKYTSVC